MIRIVNLKKSFGELNVLENINLSIQKGEIYGLVGRSGAGKSTLLRCINGLETYDEGSLLVDGVEVKELHGLDAKAFKKQIGMIFQQFSLLNRLSVYENVALPMRCWKYSNSQIDRKVKDLLELVGIPDKINSKPRELSGGQKQRVAIARALTMDPKILLCDEATSALDPRTANSITKLLNNINQQLGVTIVIVTHQMSVLRQSCERISILENGKIAEEGLVTEIFMRQPQALLNLIGVKEMMLPQKGVNIRILMCGDDNNQLVLTSMARDLNIDFKILGGEMEQYRDAALGSVVINIDQGAVSEVQEYLRKENVSWRFVNAAETSYDKEGDENV